MKVSLRACRSFTYEYDQVRQSIEKSIADLGGLGTYIQPGQRVLLKVNLLMKKKPEEATTTHPVFVEALADILVAHGSSVLIADSPGGPFTEGALRGVYRVGGYEPIGQKDQIELNWNVEGREVANPNGKILKRMTITSFLDDVDHVISVSKLKTHGMMKFTGAVKNMFGTIPGLIKAEYHVKMPELQDFGEMLVDVCAQANPVLSFMDGIVGMEGAGPSAGDPRPVGVVLASTSPYQLDVVASRLVGINPMEVPTIERSIAREWASLETGPDMMLGDDPGQFTLKDFVVPAIGNADFLKNMPGPIRAIGEALLRPKPVFRHKDCIGCGECAEACPAKVIDMKDRKPYVELSGCIRCYCCQELCPAKAVDIHRPVLMKLMTKF